ncbi:MAG: hypothetical protein QM520_03740 [Gammaproteobacteria bacterium]|nr:hypothetical protein [Gammaproteobacteria bacterium]
MQQSLRSLTYTQYLAHAWVLIECLFAVVLVNIGLTFAWHTSLKLIFSQSENLKILRATLWSAEILHRIRLHPPARTYFNIDYLDKAPYLDCYLLACNAEQWAKANLYQWQTKIKHSNSDIQLKIFQPEANLFVVTLRWTNSEIKSPTALPYTTCSAGYYCHILFAKL